MASAQSIENSIQSVIKEALLENGAIVCLTQACKAINAQKAHLCILFKDINNKEYKNLVTALCKDKKVPLIEHSDPKKIGRRLMKGNMLACANTIAKELQGKCDQQTAS